MTPRNNIRNIFRLLRLALPAVSMAWMAPLVAVSQEWPTDDEWRPFTQGGFVIADGCADSPGAIKERDLCGTPDQGTFMGDFDEDFLYFRIRVDGDPNKSGGLVPYGWVVLLDTARTREDYEYFLLVDGIDKPESVRLYGNVTQANQNRIADPPDEPPMASWTWAANGRTVMADSTRLYPSCNPGQDWFIDFYVPTAPMLDDPRGWLTLFTPIYSLSGASSSASNLNSDIGNENVVGDALTTGLSDPWCIDNDDDFQDNCEDNCPFNYNPEQADADFDGIGDVCDDDNDGDGVPDDIDCNPTDGSVYQGAPETCNLVDEDCDGATDEGLIEPSSCGIGVCANTGYMDCILGEMVDFCELNPPTGDDSDCDALDDNCNGEADEAWADYVSSCGVGACMANGVVMCIDHVFVDTCAPGSPVGLDDDCDGVDQNCDGDYDEHYFSVPTTCGTGVCASTGSSSCVLGMVDDNCEPGPATGDDTDCDDLDDDCDGFTDESWTSWATECGTGACARAGVTSCVDGDVLDSCVIGPPTGDDTDCDGIDDDCDESIDEAFLSYATSCGIGACASAGLMTCVDGDLHDSCLPGLPSDDDDCDTVDDDCDGTADDDYDGAPTTCGAGACVAAGEYVCVNGTVVDNCVPGSPTSLDDDCDGNDDDCDGTPDDGYVQYPTSCGEGVCANDGMSSCVNGVELMNCVPGAPTGDDTDCDGLDDDCDSTPDDGYLPYLTSCGDGVCAATGTSSCELGVEYQNCTEGEPTGDDTDCNSFDEDCDGTPDDGYVQYPTSCGEGVCAATGTSSCDGGVEHMNCTAGAPTGDDTDCNGFDEDCDGTPDDGYTPYPTSCGVGVCAAVGTSSCDSGVEHMNCTVGDPTGDDTDCNGFDEDCDGTPDDGYLPYPTSCGEGVCAAAGTSSCDGGVEHQNCTPGDPTGDDIDCTGFDEDCDGTVDDGYISHESSCGTGVCASVGTSSCVLGTEYENCVAGAPTGDDTDCNGFDENCDGTADEGWVPYPTECGVGVCYSTGMMNCVDGRRDNTCATGDMTGDDTDCDGLDDNCDGDTDENYVGHATSCGVGVCASTGLSSCDSGVEHDNCTAGFATGDDTDCDDLDDDCDGTPDDGYEPHATSCGVGACAAVGTSSCVIGVEHDNCTAGEATGDDTDCDDIDDDCDGTADDGYAEVTTYCGTGPCSATGKMTCVNGTEIDTCEPGSPASPDNDCDGNDDNCDGTPDDGYAPRETQCGLGVCASTGVTSCVSGVEHDSCVPGATTGDDTDCDDIDDDCDGTPDDGYIPDTTSCGVGACASSGMTSCADGIESDSCEPGPTTGDDTDCDDIDDNCDGTPDDGYVPFETQCGVGACASVGISSCVSGLENLNCNQGPATGDDTDCDDIDDDCDGTPDDGYVRTAIICGTGACLASGWKECVDGSEQDVCVPGEQTGDDTDCDGVDDNCNGPADEGYIPMDTSCGDGSCASTGVTSCDGGVEHDSCEAGSPTGDDTDCDGVDDDCDGTPDDGYAVAEVTCGVGACFAAGTRSCVEGGEVVDCTPGPTTGDDTDCDGVDDNCDGEDDNAFVQTETSCGTGACEATGLRTCVEGELQDSCTPGTPADDDATCDGVDDDCDETADEDYVPVQTFCGVGVCQVAGVINCIDGEPFSDCVLGTTTGDDSNCNGIDEDCSGVADDNFLRVHTTCGVGACAAAGLTECVDGVQGDSCVAGTPADSDADCDNVDDDCSGETDEDFVSAATTCGEGACESTGATSCVEGGIVDSCLAGEAVTEVCNGADDDCDQTVDEGFPDSDGDEVADCIDPDDDDDDIIDEDDNCPLVYNPDQADDDRNGVGNLCERDYDGDEVDVDDDNCPLVYNPEQVDTDLDGEGDACDCDIDDDGVLNDNPGCVIPVGEDPDNCSMDDNPDQADSDDDGIGDACDDVGYYAGGGCSAGTGSSGAMPWLLLLACCVLAGVAVMRRRPA